MIGVEDGDSEDEDCVHCLFLGGLLSVLLVVDGGCLSDRSVCVFDCSLMVISLLGGGAFCCFWFLSVMGVFEVVFVVGGNLAVVLEVAAVFLFAHWLA